MGSTQVSSRPPEAGDYITSSASAALWESCKIAVSYLAVISRLLASTPCCVQAQVVGGFSRANHRRRKHAHQAEAQTGAHHTSPSMRLDVLLRRGWLLVCRGSPPSNKQCGTYLTADHSCRCHGRTPNTEHRRPCYKSNSPARKNGGENTILRTHDMPLYYRDYPKRR